MKRWRDCGAFRGLQATPYIICGKSRGEHFRELGPVLRRILTRAGIENLHVHDLRRTVGSWLAQGGTTLHLIGDVLNHLDPKTTAGYAYLQMQQRRDVLTLHANRVLSYVPQQSRAVVEPKTLSADQLLRTDASVPGDGSIPPAAIPRRHSFERKELFKLVWTAAVSEVARKLGVSEIGLAKLCRRAAIPLPARGYKREWRLRCSSTSMRFTRVASVRYSSALAIAVLRPGL